MSDDTGSDWAAYYAKLKDRPPRHTATCAAGRFKTPGYAVDLGCGAGRDALPLLAKGWRVLGIDKEPDAISALLAATPSSLRDKLETYNAPFEDVEWGA